VFETVVWDDRRECWWVTVKTLRGTRRLGPFSSVADATKAFKENRHGYADRVPSGVRWDYRAGKWRVDVHFNGQHEYVCRTHYLSEAKAAYRHALAECKRAARRAVKDAAIAEREACKAKIQEAGAKGFIRRHAGQWHVRLPTPTACSRLGAYDDLDTAIEVFLKTKAARERRSA